MSESLRRGDHSSPHCLPHDLLAVVEVSAEFLVKSDRISIDQSVDNLLVTTNRARHIWITRVGNCQQRRNDTRDRLPGGEQATVAGNLKDCPVERDVRLGNPLYLANVDGAIHLVDKLLEVGKILGRRSSGGQASRFPFEQSSHVINFVNIIFAKTDDKGSAAWLTAYEPFVRQLG